MAAKRVAMSAVDWVAFAERVPPMQRDAFRAFKARSDFFVTRVHRYPENLPALDWASYKSKIAAPSMVDQFQKAYQALNIPYPSDKSNLKGKIDAEQKEADVESQKTIAANKKLIGDAQAMLAKIDSVPPLDEMSHEMYAEYFPDQARESVVNPTFWPHIKADQPGVDKDEIK